jgi:hypothetical protein
LRTAEALRRLRNSAVVFFEHKRSLLTGSAQLKKFEIGLKFPFNCRRADDSCRLKARQVSGA